MAVISLSAELKAKMKEMEREAYSHLVAGDYGGAEQIYQQQYETLRVGEKQLTSGDKYHKGSPLYNWGIALLLQNKVLFGFQKIALAYIEDLLDFSTVDGALEAPAFKTLRSYPLVEQAFLDQMKTLATQRRMENRVPRDPAEIRREYRDAGQVDLSSTFTVENVRNTPITIDQLAPLLEEQMKNLGPKEKRVFVGGNYRNIALLRYIAAHVENIDYYKAVIPIDLPKLSSEPYDHIIHDISLKYLEGCSSAIFEVSISDGHLMEIEKASTISNLRVVLVFQAVKEGDEPKITRMLMTTNFEKRGYRNFTELATALGEFLGN